MKSKFTKAIALLLLLSLGCKKNDISTKSASTESKKAVNSIVYNFDWENAERMPVPAGAETILSPWAAGANLSFPAVFITDKKKAEGWELLYNTFNTTEVINPRFFTIYNKYKGLIRTFFYLTPTAPTPSRNVTHTIKLKENNNSYLLNYSSNEITSLLTKQTEGTLVQPYRTTATGTWYAAEFEMNYDPNTINLEAASNFMQWEVNSVNITDISISGQSQGTVNGTMSQTGSPASNLFSRAIDGGFQYTSKDLKTEIETNNPLKSHPFFLNITSALITGNFNDIAKKILSGVFNLGSTPAVSTISLKTSANYTFSGTATDNYLIASPTLVMPGTKNAATALGITPIYNKPLGLVTLSKIPLINAQYEIISGSQRGNGFDISDEPYYIENPSNFTLDQSSYSIQFNPAIINTSSTGAHIDGLTQELVYRHKITDALVSYPLNTNFASPLYNVDSSSFGNMDWTPETGFPPLPAPTLWSPCDTTTGLFNDFFLRVSFDVVPNDGSTKFKIVKSFKLLRKRIII